MTQYEPVIGLEVHAEMLTASKMFCGCAVVDSTQAPPNTVTCPVCLGMPGVLPVINRQAVEMALRVGLALGCEIPEFNQFARKNYFYPDLPKGYQISQYEYPIAINGHLDIDLPDGATKRIGITRAHMEEDTGKLTHVGDGKSLVDLNRAGVPLLEIVSEPDIRSAAEAEAYARKLRAILQYLGVNHGDMSRGVLRFEANVSVRPVGSEELRTRTEIKNLNSIRSMVRAIEKEVERQIALWESGEGVKQATLGWDENAGRIIIQRVKESASDYRYFPEPDLPVIIMTQEQVEAARASLPELPDARRDRFVAALGLSRADAEVIVAERAVADYYEAALAAGADPKQAANFLLGEIFRLMNADSLDRGQIGSIRVTPEALARLLRLVNAGTINLNTAKKVLNVLYAEGGDPAQIVESRGLAQVTDEAPIRAAIDRVLDAHPDEVAAYLAGQEKLAKFLMGQVMRELRGKGQPQLVQALLDEALAARRS
ncbi:MAG: Asp-tRNA(Asn)/Glu-tRNA(Gln) amidotransferase subunit GatB [Anaerolineae bacterium]